MKFLSIAVVAYTALVIANYNVQADDPAQIAKSIEKGGYATIQQLSKQWKVKSDVFAEDHGPYTATVVENWQLPSGSQCSVLRITDQLQWNYQYWIFLRDDKAWRLIATRDCTVQKYSPPEQHIVQIGKQHSYLAIREMTQTGTGVQTFEESWYAVRADGLREVFSIPVAGYLSGWNMPFDREYSIRVTGMTDEPTPTVDVVVSAKYVNAIESLTEVTDLFSINRTARFKWNPAQERFALDEATSQISEAGIRGLYDDGVVEFLKHNYKELQTLVHSPKPVIRQWVKLFLDECTACTEKTALLELLSKS